MPTHPWCNNLWFSGLPGSQLGHEPGVFDSVVHLSEQLWVIVASLWSNSRNNLSCEIVAPKTQKGAVHMFETLQLEFPGELAILTLNRPEKRNAISTQMLCDLHSALDAIEKSSARVGILTGTGKAFCAGMDLEMLSAIARQSPEGNMDDSRRMAKMF